MSELSAGPVGPDVRVVDVSARGGSRQQRGSTLAAWARKHPEFRRVSVSYSETFGFQTCTYVRYERVSE